MSSLGNRKGVGVFRVIGESKPNRLQSDPMKTAMDDGCNTNGSVLDIRVGVNGVTPIWIEEVGNDGGGDVSLPTRCGPAC